MQPFKGPDLGHSSYYEVFKERKGKKKKKKKALGSVVQFSGKRRVKKILKLFQGQLKGSLS